MKPLPDAPSACSFNSFHPPSWPPTSYPAALPPTTYTKPGFCVTTRPPRGRAMAQLARGTLPQVFPKTEPPPSNHSLDFCGHLYLNFTQMESDTGQASCTHALLFHSSRGNPDRPSKASPYTYPLCFLPPSPCMRQLWGPRHLPVPAVKPPPAKFSSYQNCSHTLRPHQKVSCGPRVFFVASTPMKVRFKGINRDQRLGSSWEPIFSEPWEGTQAQEK